jgi:4-amino-4-deoxy-L-arabinose transferase-like glycosyltransferase
VASEWRTPEVFKGLTRRWFGRLLAHRRRSSLVLLALCAGAVLANAVWVIVERRGQPLDIDEAGYVAISLNDYLGVHAGGLAGWWHQVNGQPVQAPLAPALASLLDWATGPRVLNAYAVSLLAYGLLVLATAGMTKRWSRGGRATALLFVAASPVLLNYSRGFNFAELAAACAAGALYFGHRSRSFTHTGPALAWGACLGLTLLARTMTVAFIPGLVLAAAVPVAARRSRSGLLRLLGGLLLGAAVAATWYVDNLGGVYRYLTNAGYGAQAASYGPPRSVFSPHDWYLFLTNMVDGYLYAGVGVFLLVGWLACVAALVQRGVRSRRSGEPFRDLLERLRIWAARDPAVLSCAIVAAAGMTALMSSRNQGSAFIAPLVMPLVVVAACGTTELLRAIGVGRRRVSAAVVAGVASAVAIVSLTSLTAALTFLPVSDEVMASVPFLDNTRLVLWDSRGTLRNYEDGGDVPPTVEPDPGSQAVGRAWVAASRFVGDEIWRASSAQGRPPVAVFAFSDRMLNFNTVQLYSLLWHRAAIAVGVINPEPAGTPPAGYFGDVAPLDSIVTVVATVTSVADEAQAPVPVSVGVYYARSLHFRPFARRWLPDGQWVVLWALAQP